MLSSKNQWSSVDGDFNAQKFFNNIVRLFEIDPEDEWCIATLNWWNLCVFSLILLFTETVIDFSSDKFQIYSSFLLNRRLP